MCHAPTLRALDLRVVKVKESTLIAVPSQVELVNLEATRTKSSSKVILLLESWLTEVVPSDASECVTVKRPSLNI